MIKRLSLGLLVLGLGCIIWSMINIWAQTNYLEASTPLQSTFSKQEANLQQASLPSTSVAINPASETAIALYPEYPLEGDEIGTIAMPTLDQVFPIIQGTGDAELKQGVGHFTQSVLPGEADNCVLSGHRETVFRKIGKLKIGDQLVVQTVAGTFTYEVTGTRIVLADDRTVIVPTENAVLTLTTCYPFDTPGYFPERYIVSAALVEQN